MIEIIFYAWIGILSIIGGFTIGFAVAAARDYFRCKRYELEQDSEK